MILTAASTLGALRSLSFSRAMARTWSASIVPTFIVLGTPEPFSTPAASLMSTDAGDDLISKSNERSW